jgi:hypothetical protein
MKIQYKQKNKIKIVETLRSSAHAYSERAFNLLVQLDTAGRQLVYSYYCISQSHNDQRQKRLGVLSVSFNY